MGDVLKDLFGILIIIVLPVLLLIAFPALTMNYISCTQTAEMANLNYKWKAVSGCFLEVKPGVYINKKRLNVIDIEQDVI